MPYANLEQALAIAKTKSQTIGIQLPAVPQLKGRLESIDPVGVRQFNSELQKFAEDLVLKISQGITESPKQES